MFIQTAKEIYGYNVLSKVPATSISRCQLEIFCVAYMDVLSGPHNRGWHAFLKHNLT